MITINNSNRLQDVFNESEFRIEILENETVDDIKNLITKDKFEGIVYVDNSDSAIIKVEYCRLK